MLCHLPILEPRLAAIDQSLLIEAVMVPKDVYCPDRAGMQGCGAVKMRGECCEGAARLRFIAVLVVVQRRSTGGRDPGATTCAKLTT